LLDKDLALDTAITTYHSYAGRILSEHAIRLGIDATSDPLGDAALWQIASDVVRNWPDENFTNESAVSTVIDDVIGLAKLVLEHQVSFDSIRTEDQKTLAEFQRIGGTSNEEVRKVVRIAQQRIAILPMVEEFLKRRRQDGQLSFDVLDEYQDTSQSQVRTLSALFGKGHPVMAVGDPCQAIYTWRGASAGTIGTFAKYFPKNAGHTGAELFNLSITFRNDKKILEIANSISDQIRSTSSVRVDPLRPRDTAGDGEIAYGVFETLDGEAQGIAEYFYKHWFAPERIAIEEEKRTSFAVLVRKRSQISIIESALRARSIPVEVIGVGGLIYVAEVADVLSLMKVVTDPEAGTALMRHLTGPRLALGAKDMAALGAYSRKRAKSGHEDSHSFIAKIAAGNPDSA